MSASLNRSRWAPVAAPLGSTHVAQTAHNCGRSIAVQQMTDPPCARVTRAHNGGRP